jgi:hypothetical protein
VRDIGVTEALRPDKRPSTPTATDSPGRSCGKLRSHELLAVFHRSAHRGDGWRLEPTARRPDFGCSGGEGDAGVRIQAHSRGKRSRQQEDERRQPGLARAGTQ